MDGMGYSKLPNTKRKQLCKLIRLAKTVQPEESWPLNRPAAIYEDPQNTRKKKKKNVMEVHSPLFLEKVPARWFLENV